MYEIFVNSVELLIRIGVIAFVVVGYIKEVVNVVYKMRNFKDFWRKLIYIIAITMMMSVIVVYYTVH